MIEPVLGTKPLGQRTTKKPQVHTNSTTERVCADESCDKILSMYNKGPFCFTHQPTTYPRIRGRLYK